MKEELLNNRVIMDGIVAAQTELKVHLAHCSERRAMCLTRRKHCTRHQNPADTLALAHVRWQSHMKQYGTMTHELKDM